MAQQGPPFNTARKYYEWAWRPVIRLSRPHWKEPLVRRNLTWLWNSRTQAEDAACNNLHRLGANALPMIDQTILPQRTVKPNAPPHPRANARIAPPAPVVVAPPPAPVPVLPLAPPPPPPPPPVVLPPPVPVFENTTAFHFWPLPKVGQAILPEDDDEEWFSSKWDVKDANGQVETWHGVRKLGFGCAGRVGLWIKVDREGYIVDNIASKVTNVMSMLSWIDMFQWRDRLPMEVAIQQRLAAQGSMPNIHEYRGYLIDMHKRKYQVLNEFCEYDNIAVILQHYYQYWSTRREHFDQAKSARKEFEEEEPKDVIPEAFLWYVFRSLVDALNVLEKGADPPVDMAPGKDWRPIVHGDMHLGNVFVKPPPEGEEGVVVEPSPAEEAILLGNDGSTLHDMQFEDLGTAENPVYPVIVLADFDRSFFDLQKPAIGDQPADPYQDNPQKYRDHNSSEVQGQMYAPEYFTSYDDPDARLTSKTDIWGLGMMMWNLLLNLPNDVQRPFVYTKDGEYIYLINDQPYTNEMLNDEMLMGEAPYEAPLRYSRELKNLVRRCLSYEQMDRPDLGELRRQIDRCVDRPPANKAPGPLRIMRNPSLEKYRVGKMWQPSQEPDQEPDQEPGSSQTRSNTRSPVRSPTRSPTRSQSSSQSSSG